MLRWIWLWTMVGLLQACAHPDAVRVEAVVGQEESVSDVVGADQFKSPVPEPLSVAATMAGPVREPAAVAATTKVLAQRPIAEKAWRHFKLPGKTPTRFRAVTQDGRKGIKVNAQSSASMLRYALRVEPQDLSAVRFSWKVPGLIAGADVADRDRDDAPVRIVLAFEGDTSRFSARNAMLSELSRAISGEPLPYATLMYVWCNQREPGSVVHNPRTDRIRKLVVESGGKNLNQWLDYERDIRADFIKAFGEEPGALVGVALMTDTDNTKSDTTAWYGPVSIGPASRKPVKTVVTTAPALSGSIPLLLQK